jgi:hypothetical protein
LGLTIYTCVLGNTDPLHEPAVDCDADFVCFADQPIESKRWRVVRIDAGDAPTRTARTLKLNPHRLFPRAEATLWQDACFTLRTDPRTLLEQHDDEIVTFVHRDRARIVDEAHEIARLRKARPIDVYRQLAAYQSEGFDTADAPLRELSCNGVVLRRRSPRVDALCELWTRQIERYTLRDQMSLDYCAWKLGMRIGRWPGVHSENPHFEYRHFRRPVNDF